MRLSKDIDMTNGPILKKLFLFTIPIIISGVLQLLYNAADLIVIGNFAKDGALAAVGATSALINLILNIFIGFSVGVSVIVARSIGASDHQGAQRATHTAISLSIICGFTVGIIGFFASKPLLQFMDTPSDIIDMSAKYMKIYFLGSPANLLYNFGASILRANGDTRRPLYFLTLSGLVNIILNLILVILFDMDVDGVAIATVVSQIISATLVVMALTKSEGICHLDIKKLKIHFYELKKIVIMGLPAGIQGSLFSISNVIIQSSINSFGTNVVEGNTAAGNIEGFIYIIANSFNQAALTFTSQNYGARKYSRTKKVVLICMISMSAVCIAVSGLFTIFGKELLSIYCPDNQIAIDYGMIRIKIMFLTYFLLGLQEVMVGQLRGLGYSIQPMLIAIFCICGLRLIWVYTVFSKIATIQCLYWSYPISWIVAFAAMFVCYLFIKRKLPQDGEPFNK